MVGRAVNNSGMLVAVFVAFGTVGWGADATVTKDADAARSLLNQKNDPFGYVKQHADKRFEAWQTEAEAGSAEAQWLVGTAYLQGAGVKRDQGAAAKWYKKSAEQAYTPGIYMLGMLNEFGAGLKEDPKEALTLYRKCAEKNEPFAVFNMGRVYREAVGVDENVEEALKWYQKAAILKSIPALTTLAGMYETGDGVKQDAAQALGWYQQASDLGNGDATAKLVFLYEEGKDGFKNAEKAKTARAKLKEQLGEAADDAVLLIGFKTDPQNRKVPNGEVVIDGKKIKLNDQRGKVVVLKFGATWCGPCRAMIPHKKEMVKRLEKEPFVYLDVDTDDNPVLSEKWGIQAIPAIFVIDPAGVIRFVGPRGKELDEAVDSLLKDSKDKKEK